MKKTPDNQSSGPAQSDQHSVSSPEALTDLARSYFATDFPNPLREGCPPPGALQSLIRRGELPDDELSEHLFDCSECFSLYRKTLTADRSQSIITAPSWWQHLTAAFARPPVIVTTSVLILLLVLISNQLRWPEPAPASRTEIADQSISPAVSLAPTLPHKPVTEQPKEVNNEIAWLKMSIDLDEYAVVRDSSGKSKAIMLPSVPTRLQLHLPAGSSAGQYSISLMTEAGRTLAHSRSRSRDGKVLITPLNLSAISPGTYLLQVKRNGEAPDLYPARITNKQ